MTRHWSRITVEEAIRALRKHEGNVTHAAQTLGCSWPTLQRWIKREPEIAEVFAELRKKHGIPAYGKTKRIENQDRTRRHDPLPGDFKRLLAEYMDVKRSVDEIHNVLQLAQLRCRNAASLRSAGLCHGDTEGTDACFSSRLSTADARVMAERLALRMSERIREFFEDENGDDDGD